MTDFFLAWYLFCGLVCCLRLLARAYRHGVVDRPLAKWLWSIPLALLLIPLWGCLLVWILVVDSIAELQGD